jgi:hypothetical protein
MAPVVRPFSPYRTRCCTLAVYCACAWVPRSVLGIHLHSDRHAIDLRRNVRNVHEHLCGNNARLRLRDSAGKTFWTKRSCIWSSCSRHRSSLFDPTSRQNSIPVRGNYIDDRHVDSRTEADMDRRSPSVRRSFGRHRVRNYLYRIVVGNRIARNVAHLEGVSQNLPGHRIRTTATWNINCNHRQALRKLESK